MYCDSSFLVVRILPIISNNIFLSSMLFSQIQIYRTTLATKHPAEPPTLLF